MLSAFQRWQVHCVVIDCGSVVVAFASWRNEIHNDWHDLDIFLNRKNRNPTLSSVHTTIYYHYTSGSL